MNIPTADWKGYAEIEITELGPRAVFDSNENNPLCLTNLQTAELAELISTRKAVVVPMSARQVKIAHKSYKVTVSWANGNGRSSCTFDTEELLLQLKPKALPEFFKKLAAVSKKAKAQRKK